LARIRRQQRAALAIVLLPEAIACSSSIFAPDVELFELFCVNQCVTSDTGESFGWKWSGTSFAAVAFLSSQGVRHRLDAERGPVLERWFRQ